MTHDRRSAQGPVPAHLRPEPASPVRVAKGFRIRPVTVVLRGYLGKNAPTWGVTKTKEVVKRVWSEVATGEPTAHEEMDGWDEISYFTVPRDYCRFSFCEHSRTDGTESTRHYKAKTFKSRWWYAVCWQPTVLPGLRVLEPGHQIELTARIETYKWQGETRDQLVVSNVRPLRRSKRRPPVPEYDFDLATEELTVRRR